MITQVSPNSIGSQEYSMAREMWDDYHADPNMDDKVEGINPSEAIKARLEVRFGAHPLESAWICRQALQSVLENMNQR